MVKSKAAFLSTLAVAFCIASQAGATILFNPIVTMVGDGTAVVSGQGRTTTINLYQNSVANQLAPVSSVSYNSGASGTRLINSDSATSEANLSNNPAISNAAAKGLAYYGTAYAYSAGYDAANGTASVTSTATNANRVIGYVNVAPNLVSAAAIPYSQTQAAAYDNNNMRSATGDDAAANVWSGGTGTAANAGWRYFNTNTQVTTTNSTNVRSVEILNNVLFGSTGSTTRGIYAIGSPPPTGSGNVASLLIGTGASSSPYEFVLIDDPSNSASTATTFGFDTAYIADDSAIGAANGGIQKWTFNGTAWSLAYTMNDGVGGNRGLAGQLDTDTGKAVLWATSADGTKLEQVTDNGASSTFTTLATVPTNNLFRGVALSPTVPEPSTLVLAGFGLFGLAASARRLRKRG